MPDEPEVTPSRGRFSRAARALRSGLRRYPRAIASSLLDKVEEDRPAIAELLHNLAPHDLALSWLGHASVACQLADDVLVVDPVLSSRIGPSIAGRTLGLPRLSPAPVPASALRGVSAVLLTHAHFDHLDKPTLRAMASPETVVITPAGCARLVPPGFGEVIELPAGRTTRLGEIEILAIEPRHWGARAGVDRRRGVNSYLARTRAQSVLFAGDTAETRVFRGLDPVTVAVFGIGAYDPWEHMHATPEQVWRMFLDANAKYLLPIHHSTFELSDEPLDEPVRRLLAAAGESRDAVLDAAAGDVVVVPGDG